MKLKQRPEDFQVTESWRFDEDPKGAHFVYLMDKQKLSTFEAVDADLRAVQASRAAAVSYCGLKDKQGRTDPAHRNPRPAGRAPGPRSAPEAARPRGERRSRPRTPPPTASR